MNKEFTNKWALILGGSSGLGLASAKKLATHGMNICIVHRDRKRNLEAFATEMQSVRDLGVEVVTFNRDALSREVRLEVVNALPDASIHLLLHSVAKGSLKSMVAEKPLSKEDLDITLNAMGTSWYDWAQELIQLDKFAQNARSIAFTSEGNARVWPGYAAVSAAKSVLESLMRSMAVEFAPLKISTNCIQAGATLTPSFNMIPGSEMLAKQAQKRNPFGRMTLPEDVANSVYLLCKEEGRWINGTILKVDGGESLR